MGYERFSRDDDRRDRQDGSARGRGGMGDFRDYDAAGESGYRSTGQGQRDFYAQRDQGQRDQGQRDQGQRDYGQRDYGNQRYAQRDEQFGGGYGNDRDRGGYGYRGAYQAREEQRDRDRGYTQPPEYHGSYASDGRRFENVGRYRQADDEDRQRGVGGNRSDGSQPRGYDYQDRGFIQRAGDEVRSWFGDDDAERRRELDSRYDERQGGGQHRDNDYHSWRSGQIDALDRDYDEYRRENRSKFESEFSTWRTARQGQRDSLSKVSEQADVLGSDGEHVGTVDHVRSDRILLTKNDADAGGRHHSIPSNWIDTVDTRGVTLKKTAAEAKQHWRDEERSQAMFGDRSQDGQRQDAGKTGSTTY